MELRSGADRQSLPAEESYDPSSNAWIEAPSAWRAGGMKRRTVLSVWYGSVTVLVLGDHPRADEPGLILPAGAAEDPVGSRYAQSPRPGSTDRRESWTTTMLYHPAHQ